MIKFIKNLIIKIINKILFDEENPKYHRFLYDLSKRYVNFYQGDQNAKMHTNGEFKFLNSLILNNKNLNIFFDIGSNIGDYTDRILKLNNEAIVYCFEPTRQAFDILKSKLDHRRNVYLNNIAISDITGKSFIYYNQEDSKLSSLYEIKEIGVQNIQNIIREQTITTTIDEYCLNHKITHIDLLKIDTEGHEFAVINGAKNMFLKLAIDIVQFEFGYAAIYARVFLKDFINFFEEFGYTIYKIKPLTIEKIVYTPEMERCSYANFLAIKKELNLNGIQGYETNK